MALKRFHTKSRLGCSQCKARRIKCDESPPCCANCAKKGIPCDYQDLQPAIDNIQLFTQASFPASLKSRKTSETPSASSVSSASSRTSRTSRSSTATAVPAFSLHDLGLLHHFTLKTAETLPAFESEQYRLIWQQEVPRLAQAHPFLMHAVIGFAAAHQANTTGERSSQEAARHHYIEALKAFRIQVAEITADKADALLCFSILVCFLTMYLEAERLSNEQDPISEFISLLQTIHSSIGLLSQIKDALQTSTIGYLLQHTRNRQHHSILPEIEESITYLESLALQCNDSHPAAIMDAAGNNDAIAKLRKFYTLSSPKPNNWMHILSWPISLDPDFVTLLEQRNPVALCTLAHWCVPACNAPRKWWVGNFFERVLGSIAQHLEGTEWSDALAWPLSETMVFNGDMDLDLGEPISEQPPGISVAA